MSDLDTVMMEDFGPEIDLLDGKRAKAKAEIYFEIYIKYRFVVCILYKICTRAKQILLILCIILLLLIILLCIILLCQILKNPDSNIL
jgi:hypothetical protein